MIFKKLINLEKKNLKIRLNINLKNIINFSFYNLLNFSSDYYINIKKI